VIDSFDDVAELKFVSPAFVTLTTHDDPTLPGVNEAVPDAIEQVPETTANVTAPVPLPPLDVKVVVRPKGALVVATDRAD
jgi:hypothetical protein